MAVALLDGMFAGTEGEKIMCRLRIIFESVFNQRDSRVIACNEHIPAQEHNGCALIKDRHCPVLE